MCPSLGLYSWVVLPCVSEWRQNSFVYISNVRESTKVTGHWCQGEIKVNHEMCVMFW